MKIYVWGTGRLVGKVLGVYINIDNISGFIDNDENKTQYMGKKVYRPAEMRNVEYDAILVVNLFSEEIYMQCKQIGINLKKLIFCYKNCRLYDINEDYEFIKTVVGEEYADIIKNRYHVIRGVETYGEMPLKNFSAGYNESDYVRIKSFELAVKEIRKRNVEGAVAEVGVFRGEFAQYINYVFPDKMCYLFDTFEGFDANEALNEVKNGNATGAFVEAYKQTNIGLVLEKMEFIDKIVIKQGFFPESLEGLEEKFAFVSIDVDFEESIYQALEYFYPRLNKGGYIFVHDYNSSLKGVETAVDRYEKNNNFLLCKMPLCDANGTLVIIK